MAVEKISLKKAMEKLKKAHGETSLFKGSENIIAPVETIPSGCLAVDYVLQIGGIPKGRIIEISGKEGGGKTMFTAATIAEYQRQGLTCAFIDGEHAVSQSFFESLGVDWDKLLISRPDNLEQALEVCHMLMSTGEVDLIVYDSIPALPPISEEKSTAGEVKVASVSKVLTPALRRFTPICSANNCTLILINQMREKIGAFSPRPGVIPEDSPGGRALKHYCSLRLKMNKAGDQVKVGDKVVGHKIKVTTLKNKMSTAQGVKAEFTLMYASGIDKVKDAIDTAFLMGDKIIERPNNRTYIFGDLKISGRDNFVDALREDSALLDSLIHRVREELTEMRSTGTQGSDIGDGSVYNEEDTTTDDI